MATRADPLFLILAAVLIFYAFLFVYARPDRTPIPHAAWAMTVFASVFVGGRILSAPRYLVIGWPFAAWLAGRRAGWFRAAWPIVWVGLFGLFAFLNFTTTLAPRSPGALDPSGMPDRLNLAQTRRVPSVAIRR